MKNVHETGHLVEQPTKVSNLRPELAVFHGYTYKRVSSTVIEAWLPHYCDFCRNPIALESTFIRSGSADDALIQRHGLKKFEGDRPIRGLRIHTASPYYCEPCKDKWLRGEALEKIQ